MATSSMDSPDESREVRKKSASRKEVENEISNKRNIFQHLIILSILIILRVPTAQTKAASSSNKLQTNSSLNHEQVIVKNYLPHSHPSSLLSQNYVLLSGSKSSKSSLHSASHTVPSYSHVNRIHSHSPFSGASKLIFPLISTSSSTFSYPSSWMKPIQDYSIPVSRNDLLHNICIGTSNGLTIQQNKTDQYKNLVERYRNCTYVSGNLEITWVDKSEANDMSFLESIREITGYLLIANVQIDRIRMPNLQIIRGRELFRSNDNEFAMILIENGLTALELPNLREILAGSVGIYSNPNLSHIRTINWEEILNSAYKSIFAYDGAPPEKPECHPLCESGTCWGAGPEMCQHFTKINCNAQCQSRRCYGTTGPSECCHAFCAGGCTGPTQSDCLACKNFYDDGECKEECPSMQRYNPNDFLWEPDPNGKYAYGATCVKKCPDHLLRDSGACVRTCPPTKRSNNGECVPCNGPCQKNCQGVEVVHSGNIDQLINCTVIEGSITISDVSFNGYTESSKCNGNNTCINLTKIKPMHPEKLQVFKTLREISGYLNIQASHQDFRNLSYFSNLKTIGGRQYTDMYYVLSIFNTSLVSLNLRSLRTVKGKINIKENQELCFADTIDWNQLVGVKSDMVTTRNNAPSNICRQLALQCHEQCAKDGCWGPGPDECLSCKNYKLDDYCVDNCTTDESFGFLAYYSNEPNSCKKCHPECKKSCSGSEARHCEMCKNVKDGPYCVPECPIHKYNKNGTCEECDKSCVGGCTGPSNILGDGGCKSCGKAIVNSTDPNLAVHCIRAEEPCPDGYYQEFVGLNSEGLLKSSLGRPVCRKCHHRCKSCTGMGSHISVCECSKYQANEQCEDYCPRDYYADEQTRQCIRCSTECNGCFGPTAADCSTCKVYRIYYEATSVPNTQTSSSYDTKTTTWKFNCTAQCPPDKPHRISQSNMLDPYCSEDPGIDLENPRVVFMGSTPVFFTIIISVAIVSCVVYYRFKVEKDKTVKLTMHLSGIDDVEPLNPSNMKPNLAPLRSIKETELRKGNILGSGFGGTVYQGFWYPEGLEHKEPRPVAIKVLRDTGQSNMNKEFLDEAYIMASVNHPNLVRLLAVCMTPNHLMLVTQLMPLGCLLEYVKKYKNDIGAKNLLEWCKQIARGMAYLEEHRMVHRDLALRNVLLQTPGRALISDFGLAKFLELDQSEYHSGGGKLPIKWLAPECIRERKFTHKSDVWAFGVTVWELLTFGMKPFEEYAMKDVPAAIEKGARLYQPAYMSAEVYKVMYACWFYNPEDRPNFKSLAQSFVSFARDPGRYLICGIKNNEYSHNLISNHDLPPEDDEIDYNSDADAEDSTGAEDEPNLTAMPDLTPTTHNRLNEIFGFEMRHHSDQSISNQLNTPTSLKKMFQNEGNQQVISEDVFTNSPRLLKSLNNSHLLTDANNNSLPGVNEKCWRHSLSTSSLDQKSEQPTDMYDYLLPSPCTADAHSADHSHFTTFCSSSFERRYVKSSTSSSLAALIRNPPLSANHVGINNEEYFMTRYVNQHSSSEQRQSNELCHQLSLSNGNIPHSLV